MKVKPLARPEFTMFNNYVLDHFMPSLSANGWKVLCSAIRRTIGWADEETASGRREEVAINYEAFMKDTGIGSRSTVAAAVRECLDREYLLRTPNPEHKQGFLYKLNTDFELEVEDETPPIAETGPETVPVDAGPEIVPVDASPETGLVAAETGPETGLVAAETGLETVLHENKERKKQGIKKAPGTRQPQNQGGEPAMGVQKVDPLSFGLERRTAQVTTNYAVPLDAGGDDQWADGPVDAFARLVGLNPARLPKRKRTTWATSLRETAIQWSTEECITPEAMQQAIEDLIESRYGWKAFSSPFEDGFKNAIGIVLLGGGQAQENPRTPMPARCYQAPARIAVRH